MYIIRHILNECLNGKRTDFGGFKNFRNLLISVNRCWRFLITTFIFLLLSTEILAQEVISVEIVPNDVAVKVGGSQMFTAILTALDEETSEEITWEASSGEVKWEVTGAQNENTEIRQDGLLSVALNETAIALTVTATFIDEEESYEISATATVTVEQYLPQVISVEIEDPDDVAVKAGETHQFTATVVVVDGASEAITWQVLGNMHAGTAISSGGLLTIAQGETALTLTVRATSVFDPTKFSTAIVTVLPLEPQVIFVMIEPDDIALKIGESHQFNAIVVTADGASEAVTWEILDKEHAGTTINNDGLLTISPDETAPTLTIMATSVFDKDKFGTSTVTVLQLDPQVISVEVVPALINAQAGGTHQFNATVTAVDGASEAVIWEILGDKHNNTTISNGGLLTISPDETAPTLTIIAKSAFDNSIQGVANVIISENFIFSGGNSKYIWTLSCDPECSDPECDCKCYSGCDCEVSLYYVDEIERGGIFRGGLSVENMLFCFDLESFIEGERSMFSGGSSRQEIVSCATPFILTPDGEPIGLFKGGPSNAFFIACLERPTIIEVTLPIFQGGRSFLDAIACNPGVPLGPGTLFVGGLSRPSAVACFETVSEGGGAFVGGESTHMLTATACFVTPEPPPGENMFGGDVSRLTAIFCETDIMLGDEDAIRIFSGGESVETLSESCFTSPCLDVDLPVTITTSGVVPVCIGQTITLEASNASSYLWQHYNTLLGEWVDFEINGITQTNKTITVGSEHEGLYRVVAFGMSDECEFTSEPFFAQFIDQIAQPVILVDGSSMICAGGSVALHSTQAHKYEWRFDNEVITTATEKIFWATQAGNYTVTIIDENGCIATSDPVTLTASANPAPNVEVALNGTNELCFGFEMSEERILTAVSSIEATAWRWSTGATTPTINVSDAGKFTVRVTDINGCEATADTINIIVHDVRPEISSPEGLMIICWGEHVTLSLAPHTGNIQWYRNNEIFVPENPTNPQTEIWVYDVGVYHAVLDTLGCFFASPPVTVTANTGDRPAKITSPRDDNLLCEGSSIMLSAADAASYLWSTGETAQHIWVNTPGEYTLTVKDNYGCSDKDIFTLVQVPVTIMPEIVVKGGGMPAVCPVGSGDNEITLIVGGGISFSGNETFLWNTGSEDQEITVAYDEADIYSVIVFDVNNCIVSADPIEVIAVPVLNPIVEIGNGVICGSESLWIEASILEENYTYKWNNDKIEPIIEIFQEGYYHYSVTTAEGCTFTSPQVFIQRVDPPASPVITSNFPINDDDNILICLNQLTAGDVTLTFTSAEAVSWLWNTDDETDEITITETGEYYVMITDAVGCTAVSNPITVDLKGGLLHIVTTDNNTELCPGVSILMTLVDYEEGSTFEWYKDNQLLTGETLSSLEVSSTGWYHAVAFAPGGCIEIAAAVEITEHPTELPVIFSGGSLDICPGEPVYLTVSQGASYQWRFNNEIISTTQFIHAGEAGKYEVAVTDEFGCVQTTSVDVTVKPQYFPVIETARDVICQGEVLNLWVDAPDGSTFLWNTGETTQSITFNDPLRTGNQNYWVEVTYPEGCTFRSPNKNILVNLAPRQFDITVSASGGLCPENTVVLTVPMGFSAYRWRWETSPGFWENYTDENGDGTSYWIVVNQNANYEVTITNNFGCERTEYIELVSLSSAIVEIFPSGEVNLCDDGFVRLTALAENVNFLWSNGETTKSIIVTQPGAYSVTIIDPTNGCTASSRQVTVRGASTIFPATITANGPTSFCAGGTVRLTSTPSPTGAFQWLRMVDDEITIVGDWNYVEVNQSGDYMVAFYDVTGCRVLSNVIRVDAHPFPEATISPSGTFTICHGSTALLSAPEGQGHTYLWSTGATTRTINASEGTYTVRVTSRHGCSATSPSMMVLESNQSAPMPSAADVEISTGEIATLTATSTIEYPMFLWWDSPEGGNAIGMGDIFATTELFATTEIWVSVYSDELCESPRRKVTVVVVPPVETGPIYRLPNMIP